MTRNFDRMTRNSANEKIFEEAIKPYQDALDSSGFNHQLKFKPAVKLKQQQPPQQRKKNRQRRITWFNPPYSLNVKTNVGKMFLQIVKDCFPPTHKLYKICNRNTIKISYRTMPNMKRNISKSNNKKLQERREEQHPELKKVPHCKQETKQGVPCQASVTRTMLCTGPMSQELTMDTKSPTLVLPPTSRPGGMAIEGPLGKRNKLETQSCQGTSGRS